ncbi:hypothetical protein BIW11_09035 [Tropilaelaps mercedesae]|uniref:THAP-type domain-containing protein n=1 Tax=Tropilaelaps mercedesae TaxID=418985 RepID=A0A1V9XLW8_9ACAR|nr:hypothetical protein BIW11_09035 [Tropilaelaps mercedesae]
MRRSQISLLSRGAAGHCAACGRREGTNALSEVKLFQFPAADERRRQLWLHRCGLRAEMLASRAKICNIHFVSGEPTDSEQDIDYAPSRHLVGLPTDGLAARAKRELRSTELAPLSLRDPSMPSNRRASKRRTHKKAIGDRSPKTKGKVPSGPGGTSGKATTVGATDASADAATPQVSTCSDDWDDSDEAEDESLLFDEECPRMQCQRQARQFVELLARVGTLERTIGDLRLDLRDKLLLDYCLPILVDTCKRGRRFSDIQRHYPTAGPLAVTRLPPHSGGTLPETLLPEKLSEKMNHCISKPKSAAVGNSGAEAPVFLSRFCG